MSKIQTKFNVGDVVKIIDNTCYHNFKIGSVKTIKLIESYNENNVRYYTTKESKHSCWVEDRDIELVEKKEEIISKWQSFQGEK